MPPDPSSVYADDPSIADDEVLYRVVTSHTTRFTNGDAVQVNSNAFQDYPANRLDEVGTPAVAVSVYLASALEANGLSARDLLEQGWDSGYGVVSITAGEARAVNQGIVRWPTKAFPEHAMIFCLSGAKKSKSQRKSLAGKSRVVIAPPRPAA